MNTSKSLQSSSINTKHKEVSFFLKLDNAMEAFIHILIYVSVAILGSLLSLFIYLNALQYDYFIDEKFHIPQTIKYCEANFFEWDSKITTLPGLYLFSALILGPLNLCTITYLRFINFACTHLNLYLLWKLVNAINQRSRKQFKENANCYKLYLISWNIALFPPLSFWYFLYYTDVFSTMLVITMLLCYINHRSKTAAFVGALSICIRQTNVIWVAFLGIEETLTMIEDVTKKPHLIDTFNVFPCIKVLYNIFKAKAKNGIMPLVKFFISLIKSIFPYIMVLLAFIIFVIYNKGIVVGDKTAHVPTIHIMQIFYYSAFVLCFSWPYLLPYTYDFFKFVRNNVIKSFVFVCFTALIIHYNTLVHPYILADNRHYSFYIWKNFMNRYYYFKYLLIPVYAFSTYAILKSLNHLRLLSIFAYVMCISSVLVPQLLLEPRYFIIPYMLFRLQQKPPSNWQLAAETVTTIFVNIAQFLLFIFKTFNWEDEMLPQRITW